MDADPRTAVADRYGRFARDEAPGRSDLYVEWASGVARDVRAQEILARIPETHRQPPLVFAVTRMLGAPLASFAVWARWLDGAADRVVAECARRSIQTNEPGRCAALLPALARISGPIALIELGASAGLCLYPDRYSYAYRSGPETVRLDPQDGPSAVVIPCDVTGDPPLRMPDVVWRAGIDLEPLDARSSRDRDWLTGLVWPGETGRAERIAAALDVVAADPPTMVAGDAVDRLSDVAAQAPSDATVVVTTPGVLAHIPRARRAAVIDAARAHGRWVTLDHPSLHEGWDAVPEPWPVGFALALDGVVLAAADPLGRSLAWLADVAETRG